MTTSAPKAKAKPKVVLVSIATGEPEAAATRALATGLKGHPVRIVSAAASAADLVVGLHADAGGTSRPAASLFREELHVVGLKDLKTLADLQGRSVSLGADGSPTQAVARKILAARHITIKEVPLDLDNALDGLATGDLDAVAFFAPQPFGRLNDLAGGGRLHLIAAASSVEDDPGLAPSFIPTSAYPALTWGGATPTLSVAVDVMANARSGHPREAAAVVAALAAKARKTLAAQPAAEMRSVAVSR